MLSKGIAPGFNLLHNGLTKLEARTLERQRIAEIGRASLTNKTNGHSEASDGPRTINFTTKVRKALDKAAADDMRPVGVLVQKVMIEWLKGQGYLK